MEKTLGKRNLRDFGRLSNKDGLHLKEGLFFRSGKLYRLSKKEKESIEKLGIKTIIDLRTADERDQKPDDVIEGVTYHVVPLIDSAMFGITHEAGKRAKYSEPPNMPELYKKLVLLETPQQGLKKAFSILLDPNRVGPILLHCTEGKDRAGILSALFLYALGYDEETILEDYELSNARSEKKGKAYRNLIRIFMFNWKLAHNVYLAMLAKREYLLSAFSAIKENYGTIDAYLRDVLDVTKEKLDEFKARVMIKE